MKVLDAVEIKKDLENMVAQEKAKVMSEADKKALEEKNKKEQEAKAAQDAQGKKDADTLAKKPEERTPEETERVKILEEEKRKADEAKLSIEDKLKKTKDEAQKRIDELSNKLKMLEDDKSKEASELRQELKIAREQIDNLNKKVSSTVDKNDIEAIVREEEKKRAAKYLEEDVSKPREQRREMSNEEWNEWFLEEPDKAIDWRSERNIRRNQERYQDLNYKQAEKLTNEFMSGFNISKQRIEIKHPELALDEKLNKLIKEGKSEKEAYEILAKDNPKLQIVLEIYKENPKLLFSKPNGPELVMAEMEKRLAAKSSNAQSDNSKEVEELRKKNEELEARLQALEGSDEGINSTITRRKENNEKLTEMENSLVETMRSLGTPEEAVQRALKKFREGKK